MASKNILFLCTRLADYMYQCISFLAEHHEYHVIVVRYRPDENAKYDFKERKNVTLQFKDQTTLNREWLQSVNPCMIYTSGWSDRDYKRFVSLTQQVPVVLGLDNPWTGSLRQWVHSAISSFTLKPYYTKIWVAGPQQFSYATRLGYTEKDIISGVYSADDEKYKYIYSSKSDKVLLYAGRLVAYKRPDLLAKVFTEIQRQSDKYSSWRLIFAGKGPLEEHIRAIGNENIHIEGFVTPEQLPNVFKNATFFCLPSQNEHWGVVVHEAALSGLPMLLSETVSSANSLLVHGYNGYKCNTENPEEFRNYLQQMMDMSDSELQCFGERSASLAKHFSKELWSARLLSVLR